MTASLRYVHGMEELLLAAEKSGILYVLVLLLLCFVAVHGAHLAVLGWRAIRPREPTEKPKEDSPKKEEQPEKTEKSEKEAEKPQAVFYLVEKKRVKKKPKYSEPKRVEVKEE